MARRSIGYRKKRRVSKHMDSLMDLATTPAQVHERWVVPTVLLEIEKPSGRKINFCMTEKAFKKLSKRDFDKLFKGAK